MEPAEEALMSIIRKKSRKRTTVTGKVKLVDGDTCTVEREGLPDLEDVRLNAVSGEFEDVFLIVPKQGSEVMVLEVEGAPEENVIVKYTEIERIYIKIKGGVLELKNGKFTVKNGDSDLRKIVTELLNQLNNAIIQTPSGPGNFSPDDKMKFMSLKTDMEKLFE